MTGKTHQIIGLTCGLSYFLLRVPISYNPGTFAFVLVASSIASLLPDIDNPAAKIWNTLPFGHVAGELINPFLQHRNISHSFLGLGIVGIIAHELIHRMPLYWGINGHLVFFAFIIGYCSHIVADMVTVEGVPLLFPNHHMFGIPPRPFQHLRIKTGHWFENLLIFPAVNILLIYLLYTRYWEIKLILFHA
jgi:inner membrane protein